MGSLVAVDKAQCRIGGQALLRIGHFAIERGQHWCVFGRNGSGKTLLADLIAGKRRESSSYVSYAANFDPAFDLYTVSFEEQQRLWERDNRLDISEYSSDAQDKGTIVEILIRTARAGQAQDEELFASLIDRLALKGILSKGIRFLSSGQIRKVLIARALYAYREGSVRLLILDDPLESIDSASREQIRNTIGAYMDEGFSSLQLCRRAQDILPGVSHMALMQQSATGMQMVRQGRMAEVMATSEYVQIAGARAEVPKTLGSLLPPNTGVGGDDEELIRLENVAASYGGSNVLADINWLMTARDHVVIEGPNGCGKSTLLSLIDGENHKAYGQKVFLFSRLKGSGETIWETKKHFGVVSNELHNKYSKGWRVLDVVVSGFFDSVGLYDETGAAQIEEAKSWIEALGLEQLETHYYHEISFGQQRLVLLARAMVKKPRILILDEPCVGLDDYHRQLILAVLDTIAQRAQTNILYVTHVPDEKPHCINQVLRFIKHSAGGYTIEQSQQGSA